MKQLFILVFVSLAINSCVMDRVYNCKIKNESCDKILIKISFDENFLDSVYSKQKSQYTLFLKQRIGQDSGVSIIDFDSVNMKAQYEVLPKAIFSLEHGMTGPSYLFFKDITIVGNNTMELQNKIEMDNAFKKVGNDYFLTIE